MGGSSKGGGGTQTTQANPEPWAGAAPYLSQGLAQLNEIYAHGQPNQASPGGGVSVPDYYPGSTVAPMSPWTQSALAMQAQRGFEGSPLTTAAQDELTKTMQGFYLYPDSNPYLQATMDAAVRPIEDAYNRSVMPGIDSAFSSAGRYGSGAQVDAYTQAQETFGQQLGDVGSQLAYQNYGDERNRQQQGMMWAPELAKQDYIDINQIGTSGSAVDAFNQALTQADIDRYNYGQDADWNRTMQYLQAIQGAAPFGSTSTTQMPRADPFQSAIGTGVSVAGIAAMFM